jgi:hypothetical protein
VVAAVAQRPERDPYKDYLLSFWNRSKIRSLVKDKVKIYALLSLLKKIF